MKIYWSSKNIEELNAFDLKQKLGILHIARSLLTPAEKLTINLLKLLILIPPFILIARLASWHIVFPVTGLILAYFLILQPVSLHMAIKHLPQAINRYQSQNKTAS